jgi:hypothetical protein
MSSDSHRWKHLGPDGDGVEQVVKSQGLTWTRVSALVDMGIFSGGNNVYPVLAALQTSSLS